MLIREKINYNAKTGDLIMYDDIVYYVADSYPNGVRCKALSDDLPDIQFSYEELAKAEATFRNDIWLQNLQKSHLRRVAEDIRKEVFHAIYG